MENFKSLRIKKNISLQQAADDLKISLTVLKSFENNDILKYYDYVFYLGHFKSYCNYLELNSKELVEQFKYKISYRKNEIPTNIPKPKFEKIS